MAAFKFILDLEEYLKQQFPGKADAAWHIAPEKCPESMNGELTINAFRFARVFGQAPDKLAALISDYLTNHAEVEKVETVKAFINITIQPAALYRDTVADIDQLLENVKLPENERKKILIEFSAPNTNKPQHLGHVRNNTIGQATASMLSRVGHDVIPINLVNDRGIHICKSMLAYERFGEGVTPESTGIKGDHLVGNFYVKYASALSEQIKELRAARPNLADKNDDELFLETEIGAAAQEMLRKWEANDPAVRALWQKMNSWVLKGFDETYKRLGIEFAHTYLESETYLLGKDLIADGLQRGVFTRREDGAVIADLGKLGKKVVLRSDGTSVYITQDIGTTVKKYNDYTPEEQIWVVGDEQNLHFQMLFAILKLLGFEWSNKLSHLSYGMVNLPSGRMKSREGTVVDADDLCDEMAALAYAACKERDNGTVDDAVLRERAEIIGLGALKFMLLKFNAKTTIMFDPSASIRFEGDTGPYVQYACARIASIGRKAAERGLTLDGKVDWSLLQNSAEKLLALELSFYPAAVQQAAGRCDASGLAEYLLNLAKNFNRFYRECPILAAETPELIQARAKLAEQTRKVLVDGLNTMTIKVPESM
ncbi:MAG: arginine--tRNA ligase [Lentisphaerae bacterium]|nr:arginine--tRNA ligase [Lentisphaerota bacterium]